MYKNVLVITGSPRKNGNSDLMAEAFIKGASHSGNKVTKIEAADLKISPCRACDGCYKHGKPCSFGDDFNIVAPLIEEADVIVFSTPFYWYTFPSQLKLVIDKFYSLYVAKRNLADKECILMVCGMEPEDSPYEGLFASYDRIISLLRWKDIGRLTVKGVGAKGDIKKTDGLIKAEALGLKI